LARCSSRSAIVPLFRQVSIDEFGAIYWPNGTDLAPDAMHQTLIDRRFPHLNHSRAPTDDADLTRDEYLDQLLEAFAEIADRDEILLAGKRLARVQEWIRREAERAAGNPTLERVCDPEQDNETS
jgi:hypothetical protein